MRPMFAEVPRLQRPVSGFAAEQRLPLDPIQIPPLRVHQIERLLPETQEVLRILYDEAAFRARVRPGSAMDVDTPVQPTRRLRPTMSKEVPALIEGGLLTRIPRRQARMFMDLFKVRKDQHWARLIGNAIPQNECMLPAPHCELPAPPTIAHDCGGYRCFTVIDFRHYFYEFPLSELVRRFFAVRDADGSILAFSRMPMGWDHSMWIAQRVASAIARLIMRAMRAYRISVTAYVDGLIIRAHNSHRGALATIATLKLLKHLGITPNVKPEKSQLIPSPRCEFVGAEHDAGRQAFRLLPEWVSQLDVWFTSMYTRAWTWRDVLVFAGSISWAWYMRAAPMAEIRSVFDLVAWAVSSPKESWDATCPFTPGQEHRDLVTAVAANPWEPYRGTGRLYCAETDATPSAYGHVFTSAMRVVHSQCGGYFDRQMPIHITETLGALFTLYHAVAEFPRQSRLLLAIDNEITRCVLCKGHSRIPWLNALALEWGQLERGAGWRTTKYRVKSSRNLADEPSRWDIARMAACPCCAGVMSRFEGAVSHPPAPTPEGV